MRASNEPDPSAATVRAPAVPSRRRAARRLLLAAVAVAAADLPALAASAQAPAVDAAAMARTFTAFCDTLVPADALTPAASALGIADAIRADIAGDRLAERLLGAGCSWLDAGCAGDFANAVEGDRVAACTRMQAMPAESPAGRFFAVMRATVMGRYYAEPASWRGLALDRPPQPLGFFDAVR